jgi:hypothetical protein
MASTESPDIPVAWTDPAANAILNHQALARSA